MEIPVRAAQLTGFAKLAPQKRSLFFFTPVRHDQGHLIDLQLFRGDQSVVGPDSPGPCLSDWIAPQSEAYLAALWSALDQGVGYSLDYQLSDQTAGNLTITPLATGYLVEIQPKNAPPLFPPAPDPLGVLMRGQLQNEQHQQLTGSLLQSLSQRVPCQQAMVYLLDQPHQSTQTPIRLVEGQPTGPGCLPETSWDYLRGGKPIIDQQIGAHSAGLAAALYPVGYRSFMLVPLLAKKQLLGALLVMDQNAHFFTASYQAVVLELAQALSRNQPPVADQGLFTNPDVTSQLLETIVFNTPVGLALFRPCWQQGQITDFTYLLTNPANARLTGRSIAQMAAQSGGSLCSAG